MLNPFKQKEQKPPARVEPELNTDSFSSEEAKEIVKMVIKDAEADRRAMSGWVTQRKKDLQGYMGEKPSVLENLTKKSWMSDRNYGLCMAVCDTYQSTLLSTCWNPDSIHAVPTEVTDANHSENIEKFTKWGAGKSESNLFPVIDDFIQNRVTQGFSAAKLYWKVWYEWVDKRIPKENGGYNIKTEFMRFEKCVVENIADVDDLLFPTYGKSLQDVDHLIHVVHLTADTILEKSKKKQFRKIDEKTVEKLKRVCFDYFQNTLNKEKLTKLGLTKMEDIAESDFRYLPVDVYEWYGQYEKNGKKEEYRFIVEPETQILLSGKPLRKITRSGKRPFVGGPFVRIPGQIRGFSLPHVIAPIVNAFNNIMNQKSDFQYIENCPFFFYSPDEGFTEQVLDVEPGVGFPVSGDANKAVNFPNLSRSMAWAESDIRVFYELLEKLTGAASYFQTTERNVSGTATRDILVDKKSETRFGLWVKRILDDICEILTMYIQFYQDWAPPNLGTRVLGEDGKELIRNLSIQSLRGNYDVTMQPDIISGSKTIERQIAMFGLQAFAQSPWAHPAINPRGSWQLFADAGKAMGMKNVEAYLGKKPPEEVGGEQEIEDEFTRFAQGERFDPPEGATARAYNHLVGHAKQKVERYHELDEEYRSAFDEHFFKTLVNYQRFMSEMQKEIISNQMAAGAVQRMQQQPVQQPGVTPELRPEMGQVPTQRPGQEGLEGAV